MSAPSSQSTRSATGRGMMDDTVVVKEVPVIKEVLKEVVQEVPKLVEVQVAREVAVETPVVQTVEVE